jgi:hypothetical protein
MGITNFELRGRTLFQTFLETWELADEKRLATAENGPKMFLDSGGDGGGSPGRHYQQKKATGILSNQF